MDKLSELNKLIEDMEAVAIDLTNISAYTEIYPGYHPMPGTSGIIYLRSQSYRSETLQSSAVAIAYSCRSVGEVFPFSILLSVVLLIPVNASSCTSVSFFFVRACHVSTSMSMLLLMCIICTARLCYVCIIGVNS